MRIVLNFLHLVSEQLGGSWVYSINLLRNLVELHGAPGIVVLANPRTAPLLADVGVEVRVLNVDATNRFKRVVWEQTALARIVEDLRPHVFHGTGNTLPLHLRCASVVTIHDFQYVYHPANFPPARRWYLSAVVPRSLRRASVVIAISEATKKDAVRFGGVPEERVTVIHEAGLSDDERRIQTTPEAVRARFGLTRPFILTVGSLLPHKNFRLLIDAYGQLMDRLPHDLVIVGHPYQHSAAMSERVGGVLRDQPDRVRQLGFVGRSDVVGLYRTADMFVFPSLFEGFGIPAVEAMESGCPVIAARATSLPEIVGDAGVFFDPTDVDGLVRAIAQVAEDGGHRQSLRTAGLARARMFSWKRMGAETLRVYEAAIGRHQGRGAA